MKKAISLKKTARYFLSFCGYFALTFASKDFSPLSLSLLTANLFVGLNPFYSLILYILPFSLSVAPIKILLNGISGVIICLIFYLYKKKHSFPKFEIVAFLIVSLTPYCALDKSGTLISRLIISGCIIILSISTTPGARVWLIKGLKYKLSTDEIFSAVIIYASCGYGSIIAFGEGFFLALGLFTICFSATFYKGLTPLFSGFISAIPIAVFRLDLMPFAYFSILSMSMALTNEYSKLLSSITAVGVTVGAWFLTDYFAFYSPYSFILSALTLLFYLFIPEKHTEKVRLTLKIFHSDNIGRYSVNLTRSILSDQLFEMSAVFDEMSDSMQKLKKSHPNNQALLEKGCNELFVNVCSVCPSFNKCKNMAFPSEDEIKRLVDLSLAKGELYPADLSRNFSSKCDNKPALLNKVNSFSKQCEREISAFETAVDSRELIIKQTKGIADSLKSLATSLGRQLETIPTIEYKIKENLLKCGIYAKEISVFNGEDGEINLIMPKDEVFNPLFLSSINEIVGYSTIISNISSLSNSLIAVTVKRAPSFDAAFGISRKIKDDRKKSGDTHSVTKLSEGKFLIALNDGMGSGESAEETSATAISLVETFYKAGIESQTILSTVNKILTFSKEDNFTAMDVGIIDLFFGNVDFVKIGSPFSFIITRDTVKIIEGNSLPLGILDEMRPTVCSSPLNSGDIIVFISDGISDAFGSSADLIDFLSTQRALNPKTLADNILEKALFLNNGKALDDMTAFCIRIFKKVS